MIPSIISAQLKKGIEDFLRTTFPVSTPFFHCIQYSDSQLTVLLLLRLAIGWNFLYEGLAKLLTPNWSAQAYLDS